MRYFLVILSICGLVLAETPSGNPVKYMVNGASFEGYYISPAPDAPLVMIVHDWDGLTDYEIKRAHMLAELGYAAFAADLYGAGVRPTEFKDKHARATELYQDRGKMRVRLQGALNAAKQQKANVNNAVAIGYCFGGAAILEQARAGAPLKGFVAFHGGLDTPEGEDYSNVKGEILVFHGSADTGVTMDDFAKLNVSLEAFNVPHEMIAYSGAPHAFTVFESDRYREDADKKSWNRFTQFLTEVLR